MEVGEKADLGVTFHAVLYLNGCPEDAGEVVQFVQVDTVLCDGQKAGIDVKLGVEADISRTKFQGATEVSIVICVGAGGLPSAGRSQERGLYSAKLFQLRMQCEERSRDLGNNKIYTEKKPSQGVAI